MLQFEKECSSKTFFLDIILAIWGFGSRFETPWCTALLIATKKWIIIFTRELVEIYGCTHNVCKTVWLSEALLVYSYMTWTLLAATIWTFGRIEKMSKISFFVVTHAQSCWTVVDSTKSVSAELNDFRLWRQLKVESEIKSPLNLNSLKTILIYIF
jgi:hypothetical protein